MSEYGMPTYSTIRKAAAHHRRHDLAVDDDEVSIAAAFTPP